MRAPPATPPWSTGSALQPAALRPTPGDWRCSMWSNCSSPAAHSTALAHVPLPSEAMPSAAIAGDAASATWAVSLLSSALTLGDVLCVVLMALLLAVARRLWCRLRRRAELRAARRREASRIRALRCAKAVAAAVRRRLRAPPRHPRLRRPFLTRPGHLKAVLAELRGRCAEGPLAPLGAVKEEEEEETAPEAAAAAEAAVEAAAAPTPVTAPGGEWPDNWVFESLLRLLGMHQPPEAAATTEADDASAPTPTPLPSDELSHGDRGAASKPESLASEDKPANDGDPKDLTDSDVLSSLDALFNREEKPLRQSVPNSESQPILAASSTESTSKHDSKALTNNDVSSSDAEPLPKQSNSKKLTYAEVLSSSDHHSAPEKSTEPSDWEALADTWSMVDPGEIDSPPKSTEPADTVRSPEEKTSLAPVPPSAAAARVRWCVGRHVAGSGGRGGGGCSWGRRRAFLRETAASAASASASASGEAPLRGAHGVARELARQLRVLRRWRRARCRRAAAARRRSAPAASAPAPEPRADAPTPGSRLPFRIAPQERFVELSICLLMALLGLLARAERIGLQTTGCGCAHLCSGVTVTAAAAAAAASGASASAQ